MGKLIKWEDPVSKLIYVVSKAIGVLYKPTAIRNEGKAKNDIIIDEAKAKAVAEGESKLIELDYEQIIEQRRRAIERRQNRNIDDIVSMAYDNLESENTVSEEPVDEDWTTRFFDYVKDISNKEMKILWAKILAGEVKRPSSFSMRTLELLRNLSRDEAKLFSKAAQFVIRSNNDYFIFNDLKNSLSSMGLDFDDITLLNEAGLLQAQSLIQSTFKRNDNENLKLALIYADKVLIISSDKTKTLDIPYYRLTKAGAELYHLIDNKANEDYIKILANYLKNDDLSFEYADFIKESEDMIEHSDTTIKLY